MIRFPCPPAVWFFLHCRLLPLHPLRRARSFLSFLSFRFFLSFLSFLSFFLFCDFSPSSSRRRLSSSSSSPRASPRPSLPSGIPGRRRSSPLSLSLSFHPFLTLFPVRFRFSRGRRRPSTSQRRSSRRVSFVLFVFLFFLLFCCCCFVCFSFFLPFRFWFWAFFLFFFVELWFIVDVEPSCLFFFVPGFTQFHLNLPSFP